MTDSCVELFLMVDSLNIVRGILMEADESIGTVSVNFVEMLFFFNSWDFLTIPENARPVKVCGWTTCKVMAKCLFTVSNFFPESTTNISTKLSIASKIL